MKEFVDFYSDLAGTTSQITRGISIATLRNGLVLSWKKAQSLILPITEKEVLTALKGIGVNKASGLDGYGSLFFTALLEHC